MAVAVSATAGGTGSVSTCKYVDEVLVTAPLQVYLPGGMTEQTVGEASIVSQKAVCHNGGHESIEIHLKLDDEIKPYGLKIKDTITSFENKVSLDFRLKELVNSTDFFDVSIYGSTEINHFGGEGIINAIVKKPAILFWVNTETKIDSLISAVSNGQVADDRPLRCSLNRAYVILTKKASGTDGLQKDLSVSAFFRGPLQFCN
jgi:hypothetical protein